MKAEVFLFGKMEDCLGWFEFLNIEGVSFQYKGKVLGDFERVNILAGYSHADISKAKTSVFLIEPKKESSRCIAPSTKKLSINENVVKFYSNISSNLVQEYLFNGFQEFSAKKEFSIKHMRKGLFEAFNMAKIPYVHLWYYPFQSPSVLLFRQDIDYVEKQGIRKLIQLTDKFSIAGTYFVNISGEEEYDEVIGHLKLDKPTTPKRKLVVREILQKGNELANHGYWHYVFDGFDENLKNIEKGSNYLKELFNVDATGFASPGAEWNSNSLKALDTSGFVYTCNGCSDVVGFPFHPYVDGERLKMLEMIFYRICDASFEPIVGNADGLTPQEIEMLSEILETHADEQIKENKPIAIFGHPHLSGKIADNVYLPIFRKIQKLGIPSLSVSEFAKWWVKRESIKMSCFINNDDGLVIKTTEPAFVRIILNGKKKILKVDDEVSINVL